MKRHFFGAALAAIACSTAAHAQSAQEMLDTKYDRALAAGYKAMMLCSAIGNAEKNGAKRTPESVHEWELTGIQAPLNDIVQGLEYEIVRRPSGQIAHVAVQWDETMPARVAVYFAESGCSALPIGTDENWGQPEQALPFDKDPAVTPPRVPTIAPHESVMKLAFGSAFGAGTRTTAVYVKHKGEFAGERYADGFSKATPQRTWSVAKSIAATLVGAAVHSGEFAVSDPINLNYWRSGASAEPRNAITIDHALRMATGRYSDTPGNRTDPLYWGGSSVTDTALGWPLINKPGTVFRYSNNDTLLAIRAIDSWISYYPASEFFEKMGMNHTVAETDIRGGYVLSSQVWSTASDLAKLGQLYLDDGIAPDGERVLPENWREYVSAASGPQPQGRNYGYGAGFWLMNNSEGVPADTFAALGNRGQYVVIVPSRDVVIVRRGEDPVGSRFDIAAFTRDVLASLDK
jgi:CubicO group peptidase (beta-lactamase class C family)